MYKQKLDPVSTCTYVKKFALRRARNENRVVLSTNFTSRIVGRAHLPRNVSKDT